MATAETISGTSIRDLPPDVVRGLLSTSTIAVGKYHLGDELYKSYHLNRCVDKALGRLGHRPADDKRLILNQPPQTGKTSGLINFIAKYKCTNPDRAVIYITYSHERAKKVGREIKNTFRSIAPIYGLAIDRNAKSNVEWDAVGHRGSVISRGTSEAITGYEADLVVFDDPYKGPEDADSPGERQKILDIWEGAIRTRLAHDAIVIVTQTRWHVEDLTGHLVKQMAMEAEDAEFKEFWHHLCIPAIAEDQEGNPIDVYDSWGDLIVRAGETPECRFPKEHYLREKTKQSKYMWESLYQQRPQRSHGAMWPSYLWEDCWADCPSDPQYYAIGIDPSMGNDMTRGDFAAIVGAMSIGDGNIYVRAELGRWGPHDLIDRLIKFCKSGPRVPDAIGFEQHQFQTLIKDIGAKRLVENGIQSSVYGMKPESYDPLTHRTIANPPKVDRISRTLDPLINKQMLKFERSNGCSLLVTQLEEFPNKKVHDDGPDGLEIAIRSLKKFFQSSNRFRRG